jgi:predicted small secreted protein
LCSRPGAGAAELDYVGSSGEIPADTLEEAYLRKLNVLVAAASALWVSGCNTVAGLGKDVTSAGRAVTSTADDVKK